MFGEHSGISTNLCKRYVYKDLIDFDCKIQKYLSIGTYRDNVLFPKSYNVRKFLANSQEF